MADDKILNSGKAAGAGDAKVRSEAQSHGGTTGADDTGAANTYEACMKVYRWMSERYRKTLDALAK